MKKSIATVTLFAFALISGCADHSFKAGVPAASAVKETPPPPAADATVAPPVNNTITSQPVAVPSNTIADLITECSSGVGKTKVLEQTISFPERRGCNFGVAPNLEAKNEYIQAREISSNALTLPKGKICEIAIESAPGALFEYDDMFALTIEDKVLFVNTVNLLPYLEKKDGIYQWDFSRVVGQKPSGFGGQSYCIGEAAKCIIPDTEKVGPVAISLPNEKIAPISVSLQGKSKATMSLTAMGDDDDTDCSHKQLDVKVSFKYLP